MDWLLSNQQIHGKAWSNYNMGVVAYKMNNLPLARYHWEVSQQNGFTYPGLQKNLSLVRSELGLENVEKLGLIEKTNATVFSYISSDVLSIFLLISGIGLFGYWWKKKIKPSWATLSVLAALFIALSGWPIIAALNSGKSNQAIVMEEVSLHEGPSTLFDILGKVPVGLKIKWKQKNKDWGQIEQPVEFMGWVKLDSNMIKELDERL